MLQEAASASLGDWFEFLIESPLLDLDAAPCGGARFPVEARMDARTFAKFAIDVAVGDAVIEPVESVEWGGWLAFPRRSPNRRVKDLIDLATLVRSRELDPAKAGSAIEVTFGRRGTHAVPRLLDPAPEVWRKQFAEMAEQCLGGAAMDDAFRMCKDSSLIPSSPITRAPWTASRARRSSWACMIEMKCRMVVTMSERTAIRASLANFRG